MKVPTPVEVMMAYGQAIDEVNKEWRANNERHSFIPEIRITNRATEILYGEKINEAA